MESFYTIVYCQISSTADEKISLGLLLRLGDRIIFRYSHDKLTIIKELLPEPAFRLLKANLRNLEGYFDPIKELHNKSYFEKTLFRDAAIEMVKPPSYTSASYINYLNTYSTNLISFSRPFLLSINKIDNTIFEKLYHEFVFESDQVLEHGTTIYERVRKKVNPLIRQHVNLDIHLTSENIPELVLPTKVWFIGQNKVDVTGEIFDFEKRTYFLKNEIASHLNLIHALQASKKGKNATHFLVGKEPAKRLHDNHSMWKSISNLKYVTFVPIGELQQINEYVVKHKVAPFIEQPIEDQEPGDETF
jgi:hypothetical protein